MWTTGPGVLASLLEGVNLSVRPVKTLRLTSSRTHTCQPPSRPICTGRTLSGRKVPVLQEDLNVNDYGKPNTSRKRLYVFGLPKHGALGVPTFVKPSKTAYKGHSGISRPVRHELGDTRLVTHVAAGHGFSLVAVKPGGGDDNMLVYGTGLNTHTQIGYQAARVNAPMEVLIGFVPIQLPIKSKSRVLALGCGRAHSVVSTSGDGLFTFGDNSAGQCGRKIIEDEAYFGSKYIHRINEVDLGNSRGSEPDGGQVVKISTRFDVTYCVTKSGRVMSFGSNAKGQLGRGRKVLKQWEPAIADGDLAQEKVTAISTSGSSTMTVTDKGEVFAWGCNETGNIDPHNPGGMIYEPRHLKLTSRIGKVVDAAAGELCSFIVNDKGDVYTWGLGPLMGLGPNVVSQRTPTLIPPPLFGRNEFNPESRVQRVLCSYLYAGAITTEGSLYTWGKNKAGWLGVGPLVEQFFPFKVCLGGHVVDAAFGVDHTLVLSAGGF